MVGINGNTNRKRRNRLRESRSIAECVSLGSNPALVTKSTACFLGLERVKGIEPSSLAWEAKALPLSYTRRIFRILTRTGRRKTNPR
jgi:hypothetical protein